MYRCPRCLKAFTTEGGVTYHWAQPRAACNADTWSTEVVIPDPADGELDEELDPPSPPHPSTDSDHANRAIEFADEDFLQQPQIDNVRSSVSPAPHDRKDSIGRIVV
ncbi:hypothetical protein JVT61DRAFT_14899 [Boletus reticuloceps]|uniref:Uncharacterized protein n=1 Tax=Boletus reticuloceps TaxID=495285 RepID=A0A8I2YCM6_9AGAM|nr:hypothetical protein JVT61DRAFT_14899 [Boletus reticuloceps]